jgi:hypothetical protein
MCYEKLVDSFLRTGGGKKMVSCLSSLGADFVSQNVGRIELTDIRKRGAMVIGLLRSEEPKMRGNYDVSRRAQPDCRLGLRTTSVCASE